MDSLDDIIKKITEASDKSESDIKKIIEEKKTELSGLVSDEGAAYMVGRELGVNLLKKSSRELKIKNLMPGLRSVEVIVKVLRKFEPREFESNGKKGKVANLVLGDETGTCRMSFWNDEIEKMDGLEENDVIKISGGWVKDGYRGEPELRLGKGSMEKVEQDIKVSEKPKQNRGFGGAERKDISELDEGDLGEIKGCMVQIFNRKPFYKICPECEKSVNNQDDKTVCKEHGEVEAKPAMVIAGVLDDGTGNIRSVFFRDMAEKMFGKKTEELWSVAQEKADALAVYDYFQGLGKEMLFKGRVKRNDYNDSLEFVVNTVQDLDVKKEAEKLVSELSG